MNICFLSSSRPCEPEPRRSTRGVNKHKKDDALVAHLKSSEQNPAASDEPSSSVTTRSFYKSGKLKRTNGRPFYSLISSGDGHHLLLVIDGFMDWDL